MRSPFYGLLALSFALTSNALAYPVALQCKADRSAAFVSDPATLGNRAAHLDPEKLRAGLRDCQTDLRNIRTMLSGSVSRDDRATDGSGASSAEVFALLQACHAEKFAIGSEDGFAAYRLPRPASRDAGILVSYPFDNPFNLIAGSRKGTSDPLFKPISERDLKSVIRDSVAFGIDPYLMIAIGVSEQASEISKVEKGSHDYHLRRAIGCAERSETTEIRQNPALERALARAFRNYRGRAPNRTPTLVCLGQAGKKSQLDHLFGLEIFPADEKDSAEFACCLQVGIELPSRKINRAAVRFGDRSFVERTLTYEFFRQNLARVNTKSAGEAARMDGLANGIEKYLIQSSLTGSLAGHLIAPFRLGVDSYREPNYGRIAIDYILNTLMVHPLITRWVAEAGSAPSALCIGRATGTHVIDTDEPLRRAEAAPRMKVVRELWEGPMKTADFSLAASEKDLHSRYLAVFLFEERSAATRAELVAKLGADVIDRFDALLYRKVRSFYRRIFRLSMKQMPQAPLTPAETSELHALLAQVFAAYFDQGIYAKRETFGKAGRMDGIGQYTWTRKTPEAILVERVLVRENEAKYGQRR